MLLEFRTYAALPGCMEALQRRFRDVVLPLWSRHGIVQVAFATPVIGGDSSELHYLLQWHDLADRERRWNAFAADPAWVRAKAQTEAGGPLVGSIRNIMLAPTGFSALR